MATQLAPNFYLNEFIRSQTAQRYRINNTPSPAIIDNLKHVANTILQPVRDRFGVVQITSGYRSVPLNTQIHGSKNSHHTLGAAADFVCPGISNRVVYEWVRDNLKPNFDQLILEFHTVTDPHSGWIHVSSFRPNRSQVIIIN